MSFKKGRVITPEVMEDVIARTEYHLFERTTTMACALTLSNGFTVVGLSASVPTTGFNPTLGMKYSHDDAMRKLGEYLAMLVYEGVAGPSHQINRVLGAQLDVLKENDND
jgi:hypothetical protein